MSSSRPTIYDVAQEAGVSKSLVSLVLRGGKNVSEQSRHAVDDAIRRLNYQPNRAASDLASRHTHLVGVLIDDYANPWFVDLVRGLEEVLLPRGYRLSVADSVAADQNPDPLAGLLSMRADGLIIARDMNGLVIAEDTPPYVIAGSRTEIPESTDSVANDDLAGARLATEHLLELGHENIAHLSVSGGAGTLRRASFTNIMRHSSATAHLTNYRGPATEEAGYSGALELLRNHPEITAIFAANDVMAIGALGAAQELGLRVPRDISVIGYDNTALAQTRLINLSTVDDDSLSVGRESGRLLLARIADAGPVNVRRTLTPSLVLRGTTAPPR